MRAFGIKCRRLDLFRGIPLDPKSHKPDLHAERFMQPTPYEDMENDLISRKPWIDAFDGSAIDLSHWDENLDNWWHALELFTLIDTYLTSHYMGNYGAKSLCTGFQYKGIEHMEKPEITFGLIRDTDWEAFI